MFSQDFFTHYPSRLLWTGGVSLSLFAFFSGLLLMPLRDQPIFPLPARKTSKAESSPAISHLNLNGCDSCELWDLPSLEDALLISFIPPRPGCERTLPTACLRIKGTLQSQNMTLPGRIYLSFNQGTLGFQSQEGPFWLDLSLEGNETLTAQMTVVDQNVEVCRKSFSRRIDDPPLQKGEEFPLGSALRILSEARWWGADLLSQLGSLQIKQRLEIGSTVLDVGNDEWICWKEGRWALIQDLRDSQDHPIARIRATASQQLEWDVWDSSYVRLACPLQTLPVNHIKTEDWLGSLRIRSEKQMSCVIEKQCLILRSGDWVLKENGHWRVLHKAEDKQQLVSGHKAGDLFVLDKIDFKQKSIKGRLFLACRTQMLPIESMAMSRQDKKRLVHEPRPRKPGLTSCLPANGARFRLAELEKSGKVNSA